MAKLWGFRRHILVAVSLLGITLHLVFRFLLNSPLSLVNAPLLVVLVLASPILISEIVVRLAHRDLGADFLAGLAIITSLFLKQYLAGSIIVLMLSGGELLETFAIDKASSVLRALAKRTPRLAHLKRGAELEDVKIEEITVGQTLVILPHEITPVDGVVIAGHSTMDESFLTGEPFHMAKAPGSNVISGAVNGAAALTIQVTKSASESRYAKIMEVVKTAEQDPPQLRRLGDQLGAYFAPVALLISIVTWVVTQNPERFLAVLVIATPCPLILAIPIVVISSISLCARRGIIVRRPVALEQIQLCRTIIFDKTGTLTYGQPKLTDQIVDPQFKEEEVLALAASIERYSRHPLALAILSAAEEKGLAFVEVTDISEKPGAGLSGRIKNNTVKILGRKNIGSLGPSEVISKMSQEEGGLECFVVIDGKLAAAYRFRDEIRTDAFSFIRHLGPSHKVDRTIILSGDRESEVRYLAGKVGIGEVYAGQSPEEKLTFVQEAVKQAKTAFIGDGINDAPALLVATVGIAMGQNSNITSEAGGVVILDNSLSKIDEFIHISSRMRAIALQCAILGMTLSLIGIGFAAFGYLSPVAGAILQEVIDVIAILNALRAAMMPKSLIDF